MQNEINEPIMKNEINEPLTFDNIEGNNFLDDLNSLNYKPDVAPIKEPKIKEVKTKDKPFDLTLSGRRYIALIRALRPFSGKLMFSSLVCTRHSGILIAYLNGLFQATHRIIFLKTKKIKK